MKHSDFPVLRVFVPLAACLLSGCAAVPDVGPPPAIRGAETIAAAQSLPGAADVQWPGDGWWRTFADPQLARLIEEGLRGSPDVAAATARFRRAAGMAQEAGAARLPSLDVQGQADLEKQSYNNGFPKEFVPKGWQDTGQIAANLSFDLDLWGRNHAAHAAATSEARAAQVDAEQARLMLATAIASAYVDLARRSDQRDIRQAELDARLDTQKLVGARRTNGLETRGSVRQADAEVSTARVALTAADEAIALRRHQLAALIGAGPDRGLAIERPSLSSATTQDLPERITTELVGRRPDITAARERVEAAASRIKVARADFFPAIRIGALVGLRSLGLEQLVESDSSYGTVGPAVSLPIFHGGALSGRYRGARASYDEAVANYDQTVVTAYREVADAVTSQRSASQRLIDARAALAAAQDAYTVARLRYDGGLSNYLDVLAVQDRLLQARLAVTDLDADMHSLDIALIRALGGGFDPVTSLTSKDLPHG